MYSELQRSIAPVFVGSPTNSSPRSSCLALHHCNSLYLARFYIFILLIINLLLSSSAFAVGKKTYKIGSGGILEGYYSIGLKICRVLSQVDKGSKCHVVPTSGSLDSLEQLKNGQLDFAFVGQNFAVDAYNGNGTYSDREPHEHLIQLLRLHDDVLTVIVKDNDQITNFEELEGKTITNGTAGSDSSIIYQQLLSDYNFVNPPKDIDALQETYAKKFCNNEIDAIIMMTGHPNALVSHIVNSCDSEFIQLKSQYVQEFISKNPSFKEKIIGKDDYENIGLTHSTLAVPAILVSSNSVDNELLDKLLQNIRNNIADFRNSHQVLQGLPDDHFEQGLVLPRWDSKKNNMDK